jgi:hypothetical protein
MDSAANFCVDDDKSLGSIATGDLLNNISNDTHPSIDGLGSELVTSLVDVHTDHRTSLLPELQRQLSAYSVTCPRDLLNRCN